MIFAYADQTVALSINYHIRITPLECICHRLGLRAESLAIETLIGKIDEIDDAIANRKSTASILVDTCTYIERKGSYICNGAVGTATHNHIAPSFRWAAFAPVN